MKPNVFLIFFYLCISTVKALFQFQVKPFLVLKQICDIYDLYRFSSVSHIYGTKELQIFFIIVQ